MGIAIGFFIGFFSAVFFLGLRWAYVTDLHRQEVWGLEQKVRSLETMIEWIRKEGPSAAADRALSQSWLAGD